MNHPNYRCPECGSTNLLVAITTFAQLIQNGDNLETEATGCPHEWDETSNMQCLECDHTDAAASFEKQDA